MTGIEQLRKLGADAVRGGEVGRAICDIADQIERERECERDTIENLRLELGEARDEAAWAESLSGMLDGWADLLGFPEQKGDPGKITARVGAILDGTWRRLMPVGMEWPTVDGKPVDFVTGYEPSLGVLEAVSIYSNGACEVMGHDGIIKDVKEIHVATPKVLDADGEEVEVGDDLYSVEGMLKFHVSHVDRANGKIATDAMFAIDKWADPSLFTHRAPVIAADGRPLREGETVWHKQTGRAATVKGFDRMLGEPCAVIDFAGIEQRVRGTLLTHERPDSWERLERDANVSTCTYFGATTKDCEICGHVSWECSYDKASDLVRRAKKLAGVSE